GDVFWDFKPERDAPDDRGGYADPEATALAAVEVALAEVVRVVDADSPCPSALRDEYAAMVSELGPEATDADILAALVTDHRWTIRGAAAVLSLAQQYGTSILRNALALAEAMEIEDGDEGH
ncbi:MAG: hypothetical protein K2Q20_04985, partial [Phycisphaerales bacterium]|nr:hypothetical protein [Phycisphaerales bacterium]